MYKIWKYFEKGHVIAWIIARNKQLEKALPIQRILWFLALIHVLIK